MSAFISLFISGFTSATLLPGSSELLFLYYLNDGIDMVSAFFAVTAGNSLGGAFSFLIAYGWLSGWFNRKIEIKPKYMQWSQKFGPWVLLLSWVPFIGDPLVVAAGLLRTNLWISLLCITIGKAIRYLLLVLPFLTS